MSKKPSLASEAPFPYGWPKRVCYFVFENGAPVQLCSRDDTRSAVRAALGGGPSIYAVWPGEYRSDLFVIDEPAKLAAEIGVTT